jgi:cis-3-alkyl-4-acyloxetan-2-one decarboxylase
VSADWRALYPYSGQFFTQPHGARQHYLDVGSGPAVLMVHGNPSWSFYYRALVEALKGRHRCIVPDHIGMGLSDKPDDANYRYTLQSRIDDLERLLQHALPDGPVTLIVHDWGGAIGIGWALQHIARIERIVLLNTAAFLKPRDKAMPWQLRLGRDSKLGALLIRGFNAFADGATRVGTVRKLDPAVRAGLNAPYDSWANRIATLRFVQDIPLKPGDPAWERMSAIDTGMTAFANTPALALWGLRDFVFDHHFLDEFERRWPLLQSVRFEDAGHYVLEDKPAEIATRVKAFLSA